MDRYSVLHVRRTKAPTPAPFTIHARTDVIRDAAEQAGYVGDTALGRAIRMSRNGTWAARTGRYTPSTKFIAGVLRALPGNRFEDLFEIVETRSPDSVPE